MDVIRFINIGFGNVIFSHRIVAIVSPDSAPVKRMIQIAKESGRLIDATYGRKTRSVVITDSDHVILAAIQGDTIAHRLNGRDGEEHGEE